MFIVLIFITIQNMPVSHVLSNTFTLVTVSERFGSERAQVIFSPGGV
jgi:hypothetical protein